MRKLILRNFQSPGDLVMLTAAVRDLHLSNPGSFQTVGRRIRTLTACDDGGEQVVERQESVLDKADDVLYTTSSMRDTDASTLSSSYQATWYDGAGRPFARGNYGVLPSFTRPGTPPARSDIVLVESYAYDAAGQVYATLDPKGIESRTVFDDAGRVTARIENYLADPAENDDTANRTTRTTYNPDGNVESVTLKMNALADDQATIYAYGVTLTTSDLASGLLVRSVQYGDSSGEGDRIVFTYNRQGQATSRKDQAGTIHAYDYDALGRGTADRVTALGAGVDGTVRRIDTAYEVRGMVARLTCYSDLDGTTVVNQVGFVYNAFRQLVTDRQEHLGAISAATLAVNYAFADGSANQVRMTAMTYPNGREIEYGYGAADGLNDLLSRLEAIRESDADLATFKYLGLGTVVRTDYPAPGVRYDLWGGVPGAYTGFDRFLRVAEVLWYRYNLSSSSSSSSSSTTWPNAVVQVRHGYDRNSNRLYRENPVAAAYGSPQDQLYVYDNLNRLTDMQRGTLNAAHTALTQKAFEQAWGLDKAGNWSMFDQDDQGNGAWDLEQTRATNNGNEIVDIAATVGPVWATPAYDPPGNMVSFPKPDAPTESFGAVYDAWNRLVTVLDGEAVVAEYAYDGRSFRVRKTVAGQALHYYYNSSWQLLEERLATPTPADLRRQYVWGIGINTLVLRDRDTDDDGVLDERLYALQDSHWDMCAVVGETGSVVERYEYAAYGKPRVFDPAFGERSASLCAWEVLFQGSAVDAETGLCQIRYRYYQCRLGVWITREPLSSQEEWLPEYSFVCSVPTVRSDPMGLQMMPPGWPWNPPGALPIPLPTPDRPDSEPSIYNGGCITLQPDSSKVVTGHARVDWTDNDVYHDPTFGPRPTSTHRHKTVEWQCEVSCGPTIGNLNVTREVGQDWYTWFLESVVSVRLPIGAITLGYGYDVYAVPALGRKEEKETPCSDGSMGKKQATMAIDFFEEMTLGISTRLVGPHGRGRLCRKIGSAQVVVEVCCCCDDE